MKQKQLRGIIVKKFTLNGYGFIQHPLYEKDIFFFCNGFVDKKSFQECKIHDYVIFSIIEKPRGLFAQKIKLCKRTN
jgi:cold shock CspA family protein